MTRSAGPLLRARGHASMLPGDVRDERDRRLRRLAGRPSRASGGRADLASSPSAPRTPTWQPIAEGSTAVQNTQAVVRRSPSRVASRALLLVVVGLLAIAVTAPRSARAGRDFQE